MAKTPDPIDVEVGKKNQSAAPAGGHEPKHPAAKLDVTFQQIQKYEKGTNRVSATRLAVSAETFRGPPAYFFPGSTFDPAQAASAEAPELVSFIETKEGRDLNVAFARISSKTVRIGRRPGYGAHGRASVRR